MSKSLPKFLKQYFWDVDFEKLEFKKSRTYVLIRILEYGNEKAIEWMRKNFAKDEIAEVLFRYRGVSPMSANFWALVFGIDRKKVVCLQKPYLEIRNRHWPY